MAEPQKSGEIYVLVHGAWHDGSCYKEVAWHLRNMGHEVHTPTLAGNRPEDDRNQIGLAHAVQSLEDYLVQHALLDVRLCCHDYSSMVATQLADRGLPGLIRRLVFINGFVPQPEQCLMDMLPETFTRLYTALAKANQNALMLPFPLWREAWMNDATMALARSTYEKLNAQPFKTFTDAVSLRQPVAAIPVGKSYINCTLDMSLPRSMTWHPRLSERLGLYRYVECAGVGHEAMYSNPAGLAQAILIAGRD